MKKPDGQCFPSLFKNPFVIGGRNLQCFQRFGYAITLCRVATRLLLKYNIRADRSFWSAQSDPANEWRRRCRRRFSRRRPRKGATHLAMIFPSRKPIGQQASHRAAKLDA